MSAKKLLICLCIGWILVGFSTMEAKAEEHKDADLTNHEEENVTQLLQNNLHEGEEVQAPALPTESVEPAESMEDMESADSMDAIVSMDTTESDNATPEPTAKPSSKKKKSKGYKESDLRLLSAIIYCEARGESYAGKKAVGIVVMNRVKAKEYPNSLKKVIYQKYQFGPVRNGYLKKALAKWDAGKFRGKAAKECVKAAKEALTGDTKVKVKGGKVKNLSGYKFFSGSLRKARYRIGNHLFR